MQQIQVRDTENGGFPRTAVEMDGKDPLRSKILSAIADVVNLAMVNGEADFERRHEVTALENAAKGWENPNKPMQEANGEWVQQNDPQPTE